MNSAERMTSVLEAYKKLGPEEHRQLTAFEHSLELAESDPGSSTVALIGLYRAEFGDKHSLAAMFTTAAVRNVQRKRDRSEVQAFWVGLGLGLVLSGLLAVFVAGWIT